MNSATGLDQKISFGVRVGDERLKRNEQKQILENSSVMMSMNQTPPHYRSSDCSEYLINCRSCDEKNKEPCHTTHDPFLSDSKVQAECFGWVQLTFRPKRQLQVVWYIECIPDASTRPNWEGTNVPGFWGSCDIYQSRRRHMCERHSKNSNPQLERGRIRTHAKRH
jgi:hypothetical protein